MTSERPPKYIVQLVEENLAGISSEITPAQIQRGIEEAEQHILIYCSIREVPRPLYHDWANFASDIIYYWYYTRMLQQQPTDGSISIIGNININTVKSVKVGDVDVSMSPTGTGITTLDFGTRSSLAHRPDIDNMSKKMREHLNKFRRLT